MRILIADDEPPARERLQSLLADIGGHEIVAEAGNGLEVIGQLAEARPDLVLLDIRMSDMDGMETARHLGKLMPAPAVIFTTAYEEHALAAFESDAVDYLLKPIRRDRLAQALDRARVVSQGRLAELSQHPHGETGARRHYLSAIVQGRIQLASVAEIRFFRADQKYVTAAWPGGELLLDDSLKDLEAEFSNRFLRIHRNALVALPHVEQLDRDREGNYEIRLRGLTETLKVSRRHLSHVRKALRAFG